MQVPVPFDLVRTVRSHGWYDLPPWRWDPDRLRLGRPLLLSSGRVVAAEVTPGPGGRMLVLRLLAEGRAAAGEAAEARALVRRCLSLDLDLAGFRRRLGELGPDRPEAPAVRAALEGGGGRLLRSPTVFEDAVKTLLTTNCSWALTRAMASRLVESLGRPAPGGGRAFPTPEAMAGKGERFYRERIRAGYRARFLVALARGSASGALDQEAWRDPATPEEELERRIRALPGFGPYAAEHLLRLLGRHSGLALDAWNRGKLARLRGRRRPPTDRALGRWYAPWGEWAGLAMWLEATADWHDAPGRPW
jgi:3-methyladenine DNA glycosylase/8-oxoguanine DNA glycosylase